MQSSILTIGHGNRSLEEFFGLLNKYEISYLIDVRTNPFSKYNQHFNRKELEISSQYFGIKYLFFGDDLGGKPKDRSCYDDKGHVLYSEVVKKDFFIRSVDRLITANNKNIRVACMCSESNPCDCHRTKMIGEYLDTKNIKMMHIDKKGILKSQTEVMNELTGGRNPVDMFGNKIYDQSIGTY